jgi:hypothetical protein
MFSAASKTGGFYFDRAPERKFHSQKPEGYGFIRP